MYVVAEFNMRLASFFARACRIAIIRCQIMDNKGVLLSLEDRVALITGGSRGIGAATVRMFCKAGAKVVFSYHTARAAADKLVEQCGPENCAGLQAELTGTAAAKQLVDATVQRFGSIDALVANHGIWPPHDAPIEQMTDEQWRKTISVNLDSVFALVKHAVAHMKKQGRGGHVVIVSSTAGQRGEAYHSDYAATKGAVISFTKSVAAELARDNIYVNCVAPGWVETGMTADVLQNPSTQQEILRTIPLRRVGRPEEIAAPILFLCTSHASFITGEIFNVNGGAVLVG